MNNPFEEIEKRLDLIDLKVNELMSRIKVRTDNTEILGVAEVAKLLRMSEKSIYRLVADLELPHYKRSGKLWFIKKNVMAWMKEK